MHERTLVFSVMPDLVRVRPTFQQPPESVLIRVIQHPARYGDSLSPNGIRVRPSVDKPVYLLHITLDGSFDQGLCLGVVRVHLCRAHPVHRGWQRLGVSLRTFQLGKNGVCFQVCAARERKREKSQQRQKDEDTLAHNHFPPSGPRISGGVVSSTAGRTRG